MYVGGMSSSLPEDVQYAMYHSVPGLEHATIVRNAYAIEYDCINPTQLKASLEYKKISGFLVRDRQMVVLAMKKLVHRVLLQELMPQENYKEKILDLKSFTGIYRSFN